MKMRPAGLTDLIFILEKSACDGGISLFFFITFIGDNTLLIGAEVLVVTVL